MTDWQDQVDNGVDFPAVVRALLQTGYTRTDLARELTMIGLPTSPDQIKTMRRGKRFQMPHHTLGDVLLRLLKQQDPAAYQRLYLDTRLTWSKKRAPWRKNAPRRVA